MALDDLKERLSDLLPSGGVGSLSGLSSLLGSGGRNQTSLGVDLGSRRVKVAVARASDRGVRIENLLFRDLPPAMVSGESILDASGLTEELVEILGDIGGRRFRATLAVGGSDVFVRRVAMPRATYQEALKQLPQNKKLPIDPKHNKLDLHIMDPDGDGQTMQALVVAAKNDAVTQRQTVVMEAGIDIHAVDVDAFALFNGFEYCYPDLVKSRTTLVDIGYESSLIVVVDRGLPVVARHAYVGVSHLIEQLTSGSLLPDEAEQALRAENPPAIYSSAFEKWGSRVLSEIDRSAASASRGETETGPIYLSGGAASIDGLATFLRDRASASVAVFNPLDEVTVGDAVSEADRAMGPSFALAIGLSVRQVV